MGEEIVHIKNLNIAKNLKIVIQNLKHIYILALLMLFVVIGRASEFRYIQPADGLITGEINDIVQDSLGRMWFATNSGLVSYDGFQYRNYRPIIGNEKSLPEKYVKQLFIDSKNQLWIITKNYVVRFNTSTFLFDTFRFDLSDGINIEIFNIIEVAKQVIISTDRGIFFIFNDQSYSEEGLVKPVLVDTNINMEFQNLKFIHAIDNSQFIGITGSSSSEKSNIYLFKVDSARQFIETKLLTTTSLEILGVSKSTNPDEFLLGTTSGVLKYNYVSNLFDDHVLFEGEKVSEIVQAINGFIYASHINPKIFYYNTVTGESGKYSAISDIGGDVLNSPIFSLYQDFSGVLWIGHKQLGITLLNLFPKEFVSIKNESGNPLSLSSNAVASISSNNDFFLVGTRTGIINIISKTHFEKNNFRFQKVRVVPQNEYAGINDIIRISDSVFLIASDKGLFKLLLDTNLKWKSEAYIHNGKHIDYPINSLFIDSNQNLWCGTKNSGLLFIPEPFSNEAVPTVNVKLNPEKTDALLSNTIHHITSDSKDNLWLSTDKGISIITNSSFDRFSISYQLSDLEFDQIVGSNLNDPTLNCNDVNMIYECRQGQIWIATQGGGLNIYHPVKKTFLHITRSEGLAGNDAFAIVEDEDDNLWISTERGLSFIEQSSGFMTITNYDKSDGLQSDVFLQNSFHKTREGMLLFGGENGLSAFYPTKIVNNTIPPKILITDFRIMSRTHQTGSELHYHSKYQEALSKQGEITLLYDNNTFSIGLAAIHYQYPDGNRISYKLEGFHDQWQEVTARARFVHFSKLPAGEYTFMAYAISTDNIPSDEIRTLRIVIQPPWYRSKFMTILLLVVGLILITVIILLVFSRQRQLYLTQLYNVRLENNDSKMMFMANIAHELRTPVSLIISPVEDLMLNKKEIDKKWHNHLFLIQRNSNYILKLVNQIIDFKKIEAGKLQLNIKQVNLNDLVQGVISNFRPFEIKNKVKLSLTLPDSPVLIHVDPQKIEEVLYNLLSNAFKYTPPDLLIKVKVENEDNHSDDEGNYVKIVVFNQGSSIPEGQCEKIFERFYKLNENDDGAGIGLSFAKSLIEMHAGIIWAQNINNKGVAFNVLLPLKNYLRSNDNKTEIDEQPEKAGSLESLKQAEIIAPINNKVRKGKILIVENNDDLRNFIYEILSRYYECFEASDGIAGLKLAQDKVPDLIIVDAVMPKLNGFMIVHEIKKDSNISHIPIIMITSLNENESIINGYKAGVDSYVIKPINTSILLSQISGILEKRRLIHEKYKKQNFMVEVSTQHLTRDDVFLKKVKAVIDKSIDDPKFNVKEFSDEMQMSTTQLYRKVKALTGHSPVEFLRITRLHKAHDLLFQKNYSIKEVAYLTGFNNLSYFVKCFREYFGITPANHRDKTWPT